MESKGPSFLKLLLVLVGSVAFIVWAGASIATDDALWFLRVFHEDAASIDLYWDGAQLQLQPGSPEYSLLNEAFQEEVAHIRAFPRGVGLSDAMLNHLRAAGRLLEVHYAEPARVHSQYRYGPSAVFYVPLSGNHAWSSRVFNSARGTPLELRSTALIMAAAETVVVESGIGGP